MEAGTLTIQESIQERDRLEQEEEKRQQRELEAAQKLVQAQTEARKAAEEREAQQKQANKKLRLGAIFLSFVSLIALGSATWAWNQTKQAELNLADSLARTSLSLLAEGKDLDAFVEVIRAGKILQKHKAKDPEVMGALIANIYEGSERNRLQGHDSWVNSVSLSQDGKTLVSGSVDHTIKVWNLDFDWLMERSCDWVHNYLQYNPNIKDEDRRLCKLTPL